MTLRLRLTLLYGACFLVAGAGLLGITYALFSHSVGGNIRTVHGKEVVGPIVGPALFLINAAAGGGRGTVSQVPANRAKLTSQPSPNRTALSRSRRAVSLPPTAHGSSTPPASRAGPAQRAVGRPPQPPPRLIAEFRRYLLQVRSFTQLANGSIRDVTRRANVQLAVQRSTDKASLLLWSGVALGGMAMLSVLLGWLLAGRALRPLRTMNQRARDITEESLHQRVGVERRSDELGELAATFDALLERLERAFDAQRRFVANASHELRTPLTLERTLVEVALADPDASVASLRRACQRVLVSGAQQERVIDALLTLARGQAGIDVHEQVDLAELADAMLAARIAETVGLRVEATLQPAEVDGDGALLERLVANLIDNAIAHNLADDGWIAVETRVEAGQPLLRVVNSGPVVPPDRLDELFEPFRRLDGERIGEDRGLGLGLSIVRAIALAHGADLRATARPEGGLELDLLFAPASARPTGKRPAGFGVDRPLAGRVGASL